MRIFFAGRLVFFCEENCEPKMSGEADEKACARNPYSCTMKNLVEKLSIVIKGVSPRKNK
jgi:hypothetical protein